MENRGDVKSGFKGWLLRNSSRTGCQGHSEDVSGVRTQGGHIRCKCFFADV